MSRRRRPPVVAAEPEPVAEVGTIDEILSRDEWAVAAARQAVRHIMAADDAGAYVAVRLAAPAILARHPSITIGPRALAMFMIRQAATAALLQLPAPHAD